MTQPTILLPQAARDRLKVEATSIRRIYVQPMIRAQAIEHLLVKLHNEFPHAFKDENHGVS